MKKWHEVGVLGILGIVLVILVFFCVKSFLRSGDHDLQFERYVENYHLILEHQDFATQRTTKWVFNMDASNHFYYYKALDLQKEPFQNDVYYQIGLFIDHCPGEDQIVPQSSWDNVLRLFEEYSVSLPNMEPVRCHYEIHDNYLNQVVCKDEKTSVQMTFSLVNELERFDTEL